MIPRGCENRQGTPISLISVHTAEGATTAAGLVNYLDQPGVEASYHVIVDDTTTIQYLPDDVAAWAMLSGNHRSVQVCFTGFAKWPRSEWLAHDGMLRRGAAVVQTWAVKHNIPPVKLTPAQVGADRSGVCGHWDWTIGKNDGTHTDPGPNFPWDVFMAYANPGGNHPPPPPPPQPGPIIEMHYGQTSDEIRRLQTWLNANYASYSKLPVTGYYGDMTQAVIAEFQRRVGITGADGRDIGPQTIAALTRAGFKG